MTEETGLFLCPNCDKDSLVIKAQARWVGDTWKFEFPSSRVPWSDNDGKELEWCIVCKAWVPGYWTEERLNGKPDFM